MSITLSAAAIKRLKRAFAYVFAKSAHAPALQSICLAPTRDGITATATNLEEWLSFRLDGKLDQPVLFPWEDFKNLAGRIGSRASVVLLPGKREIGVEIHNGGLPVSYRIATNDPDEFPELPAFDPQEALTFAGDDFPVALNRAVTAASTDATRFVLNSVLFDGPGQRIVGTDGRRLVCAGLPRIDSKMQAIVPATKLLRRGTLLKGAVTVELDTKTIQFSTDDWRYRVKQVDGTYPNWPQVVPEDKALPIRVDLCDDRKANLEVLKSLPKSDRVTLYADDCRAVVVAGDGNGGFVHGVLPYARSAAAGDQVFAGFNPGFLKDALTDGFSTIRFSNETAPVKFCAADGDFAILMPLRNADSKPIRDYLDKILKELPAPTRAPEPRPIRETPKPTKPKEIPAVNHNNPNDKQEEVDPLDELLTQLADARCELREVGKALRQIQSLAKEVDRSRKKELREHKAVVDVVSRLKNIAA